MGTSVKQIAAAAILATAAGFASSAAAEDLVYTPVNPGFGGNPNNFDYLVGLAQIQNQFSGGGGGDGGGVPQITFPPITIDLGGVGTGTSDLPGGTDTTGDTGGTTP